MPEQTELKRTRQHIATLYDALNGPGYVLTCKCKQWEARGKHQSHLREQHRAHRVEMGEWVKPRKEGPDWSDLREMARNAGFSVRTEPIGLRPVETKVWAHYPPGDRYPDGSRGWARVAYGRGGACRMSVEMHAPGRDPRSRVDLVDPSPAEVLAAARLVGLVGAS